MDNHLEKNISKLGFGLMRLPTLGDSENGEIDIDQVKEMVDLFLKNGFNYFDTAYGYGKGASERAVKTAIVDRYPRESFYLASKLPAWDNVNSKEEAEQMLYTSLERTGAGYFDFYLLHNLGEGRTHYFDDYDIWNFVQKKKNEGLIRHIGLSIHDKSPLLDKLLTEHPEIEFVLLQINYADWDEPTVESRLCYKTARKHGIPVIVMEPVKGGNLASPPPKVEKLLKDFDPIASPASWAIRFAASLEGVITVLSGMSNIEQMQDNISFMKNFKPLTAKERAVIAEAQNVLSMIPSIPCTACGYCMPRCPQNINIYGVFQAMNIFTVYGNLSSAKGKYKWNTKGQHLAAASACIRCGACEEVCTQHIHITDELKRVAAALEV